MGQTNPNAQAAAQPNAGEHRPEAAGPDLAENQRQLRRLKAFLEDARGFQLALVTCDTPRARDDQLERLAEALQDSEVFLTRLDFAETPREKQLLERLRRHVAGLRGHDHKRPAVMVVGLEATLDYHRLGPDASEGLAILENANAQRDAFARDCAVPVALWLNPTATSVLATRAPDLWHWRSGTFHFAGPRVARQEMETRLFGIPLVESSSLPKRQKLERVASLRDLLAEVSATPQADTLRGRQRRMALLHELGLALADLSDWHHAVRVFDEVLQIATAIGDRQAEASALGNLGVAYADLGEFQEAIGHQQRALTISREIRSREGEADALGNLGIAYDNLGQVEKAIGHYEECLAIYREIGDRRGEGKALGHLGEAYADMGQMEKALEYHEEALVICREIGDRRNESNALGSLGTAYRNSGRLETAIGYDERALVISREIGNRRGEGRILGNLSIVYAELGQVDKAVAVLEQALAIAREINDPQLVGFASHNLERLRQGRDD
jgi:tetratricopeptide (TPR) repeat protein